MNNTLPSEASLLPVNIIKIISCFLVLLSSMRFIAPNLYHIACVGFLILYFYYFTLNRKLANTFCILSIFTLVDNGGGAYVETPAFLRYLCYFSALAPYFLCKFSYRKLTTVLFIFSFYLILTIFNLDFLDLGMFGRDLFILGLVFLVLGTSSRKDFSVDLFLLCFMIFIFSLLELVNSFQYDPTSDYLSYDTTKAFICFFSIFLLVQKNISAIWVGAAVLLTLIVLSFYVTRMIIITYIFVITILVLKKRLRPSILLFLIPFYIMIEIFLPDFDFEKIKLIYTFNKMILNDFKLESLVYLDAVRFYQLKAFLDSGMGVIFGNGLGTGFLDTKGYFNFIGVYDTAFSESELKSKLFINFHDIWVDIGYRFGIVFLFFLYVPLFRSLKSKSIEVTSLASILIIILTCSFYSSSGLIIISLLYSALFSAINNETEKGYV